MVTAQKWYSNTNGKTVIGKVKFVCRWWLPSVSITVLMRTNTVILQIFGVLKFRWRAIAEGPVEFKCWCSRMLSWSLNVFFAFRCLFNFGKTIDHRKIPKLKLHRKLVKSQKSKKKHASKRSQGSSRKAVCCLSPRSQEIWAWCDRSWAPSFRAFRKQTRYLM